MERKVLKDYYDFFSGKYIDMLPYVYAEPSDAYKRILKNCKDYYLFSDEVGNIEYNKEKFEKYLSNVEEMIEIGPGFDFVLAKKTLPVITYAKKLKRYVAVDNSTNYLKEACDFLRDNTSNIEIQSLETDLLSDKDFQLTRAEKSEASKKSQKCLILLGCILGNFTDDQRVHALKKIHNAIDVGDLIFLTADTNLDGDSVIKAYTGEAFEDFARCALWHFAKINTDFHEHVMSFDIKSKWNDQEKSLQRFYVANKLINFLFGEYGEVTIEEGQELSGYKSQKAATRNVLNLLENFFSILDVLSFSDKIKIFVCQKM